MRLPRLILPLLLAQAAACSDYRAYGLQVPQVDTSLNNKTAVALGLGDLDGDGDADALVTNSSNELVPLISNRDGTFAAGTVYPIEPVLGNGGPRLMAVADISGDARADAVIVNQDQNNVTVFYNLGDGRMQAGGAPVNIGCHANAVLLTDLGPGRLDLVIACDNPREVRVLRNNGGTGGFGGTYSLSYALPTENNNPPAPRAIDVGDLNGDGIPDIAVGTDNDLRILNSPQEGQPFLVSRPLTGRTTGVGIADANGDKVRDVSALVGAKVVQVLQHATGGTYDIKTTYQNVGSDGRQTQPGLFVTDLVRDQRSDFIVTLQNPAEIRAVISRGESGVVDAPAMSSNQFSIGLTICDSCLSLGDLSGDGRPDIAIRNGSKLSVLLSVAVD